MIKKFLDCYIPITKCNFRCDYCYISQKGLFENNEYRFSHSIDEVKQAFSLNRLGGSALINMCAGGETLLFENIVPIVRAIVENGHYVMIVTNGSVTKRFDEFIELPNSIRKHIFFKFSFHYMELKRMNLFEVFFNNVKKIKNAGMSFSVELTPYDAEIPYIDDIKNGCLENLGALCHITIARSDVDPDNRIPHLSKLEFDDYKKVWGTFKSELFDTKSELFYVKRNEFCYAGLWSAYINLESGNITKCHGCDCTIGNLYNFDESISFSPVGNKCSVAHCYNGHAWLTMGVIPQLNISSMADVRNRRCIDGSFWLNEDMMSAMNTRLYKSNKEWSFIKRHLYANGYIDKIYGLCRFIKGKLKRYVL